MFSNLHLEFVTDVAQYNSNEAITDIKAHTCVTGLMFTRGKGWL